MKILKSFFWFYYLLIKSTFKGVTLNNTNSKIIVWCPIFSYRYFLSSRLLLDIGTIRSISKRGFDFSIFISKKIGILENKIIFISVGRDFNTMGFNNYTFILKSIISGLEKQGNIVVPSLNEFLYWENKVYMYNRFAELNISHPATVIIDKNSELGKITFPFPFLLKESHSAGGVGVHKISDLLQLNRVIRQVKDEKVIIQKLMEMRRDLRVTFVGSEIVNFYWRINNDIDWRPTSTDQGSSVDFVNFPDQWKEFLINEFLKLNLSTGAFDVAWENDDLDSLPLILEVSPSYQLNPSITNKLNLENYGKFKKTSFIGAENYLETYIDQTFSVIDKIVDLKIRKSGFKFK